MIHRVQGRLRRSGMKEKLYATILLAAFLPFVVIIILLWQYCSHVFVNSIWQSAVDSLNARRYQLQAYADEYLDLSKSLTDNEAIESLLRAHGNPSYLSYLLNQRIRAFLSVLPLDLKGIYILSEDESEYLILFNEEKSHFSLRGEGRLKYVPLRDAAGESLKQGRVQSILFARNDVDYLGLSIPRGQSAIVLLLDPLTTQTMVSLSSADNLPWAFDLKADALRLCKGTNYDALLSGGEVIVSPIESVGWGLSCVINSSIMRRDAFRKFGSMLVVVILMYVFLVFLVAGIMRRQNRILQSLAEEMTGIGDSGVYREAFLPQEKDVADLFRSYNDMVRRIENQEKIILEQNRKNLEIAEKHKIAELKAMEMEINPHYLYNTLNTINSVALEHGDFQVSRLLKGYSSTLFYILKDRFRPALVRDEVNWLRDYLMLQQERFPGVFDYEVEAELELMEERIYKLLVQPFVENAILHGFEGREAGGFLSILFYENEGCIVISISDNGNGICPEELAYLRQIAENPMRQDSDRIGILNSCRRMYGYYADRWKLEIESTEGAGTWIKIHVPHIVEAENPGHVITPATEGDVHESHGGGRRKEGPSADHEAAQAGRPQDSDRWGMRQR